MNPLYEVPNQYKKLISRIISCQTEEQFQTEINDAEFPFDEKNIFVAKQLKNLEAEISAVKAARDAMNDRLKNLAYEEVRLETYILKDIEKTGVLDKIKCPEFSLSTADNPPSVDIYDAALIPDLYEVKKEVVTHDKNAIKKDILDGFEVPGAKLITRKRLVIK